eukprot:COSAG02_NODE_18703_length_924_cov_0.920000_3_plen_60_part_01
MYGIIIARSRFNTRGVSTTANEKPSVYWPNFIPLAQPILSNAEGVCRVAEFYRGVEWQRM